MKLSDNEMADIERLTFERQLDTFDRAFQLIDDQDQRTELVVSAAVTHLVIATLYLKNEFERKNGLSIPFDQALIVTSRKVAALVKENLDEETKERLTQLCKEQIHDHL